MFRHSTHKFKPFVEGLVRNQLHFEIRFHPTLLYVQFPCLTEQALTAQRTIGQEAEHILKWLRNNKSVTEVIRLCVPAPEPCTERDEVIEQALEGISVDNLDWQVLDLSIDVLLKSGARNVEILHLYSSGNWGVLQQWSGVEGVTLLPNVSQFQVQL
jgi:hypothetical protein